MTTSGPGPPRPDGGCDIIVAGASAGGVEALTTLARGLPADLPAAVLLVLHVADSGRSRLARILDRASALHCAPAVDGERLHHGRVYVAPPGHHLLVEPGHVRLSRGPRENGHRPAIDPLLRTAADVYGERVAGIVLTGTRDDGASGLAHVARRGGVTLVQHPADALYDAMPRAALEAVTPDAVLPLDRLVAALPDIAARRALPQDFADPDPPPVGRTVDAPPNGAGVACPECGGPLVERTVDRVRMFDCHVGHRYGARSLLDEHTGAVEQSVWLAVRSLEERATLLRRLQQLSLDAGRERSAQQFAQRADEADRHAAVLRDTLGASGALLRAWPDDDRS